MLTRPTVLSRQVPIRTMTVTRALSATPRKPQSQPATTAPATATATATTTTTPLYASQSIIPHLPVPTLSSTFHKYLETILPFQTSAEHAHSKSLVNDFLNSKLSTTLQTRLEERAKERDSWLSEWWNETAYMGYRGRIIPNVSYFYMHKKGLGKGKSQEERAAELVKATVEFKKLVDSERLEPEKVKGQPLCMASYKYLFNASRIPASPSDIPLAYPKETNHIVVLRNDRYFKVDGRASAKDLADAFKEIKRIAKEPGEGVGIFTAEDRDVWSEARRHLLSLGNTEAIQTIESAVLIVCLDDGPSPSNDDARAWSYWAGGLDPSSKGKGRNRWFDKHQIIIDESGESGFNGEHSMLDGTPTLRLNEFILAGLDKGLIPLDGSVSTSTQEIKFNLDTKIKDQIKSSQHAFAEEMGKQDLKMITFTGYGKNVIKTFKVSPDAWVQMVKQLAFHRLRGRPGITYESCQTRKFLLGRTEVIRSASSESKAFAEAMLDPNVSDVNREALFRKAVARHVQYSAWAADAQGVDRHMFGLRKLIKNGEQMPEVFKEPIFEKSSHWELSTSQLSSNYLDGWGYGEVVPDGYGLSYSIHDDALRWGITTLNGDAEIFGKALCDAAVELREMMNRAKDKAKL